MVYEVNGVSDKVNGVIKRYEEALKSPAVPKFEEVYAWQKNLDYNSYPDWMGLSEKEMLDRIKNQYPDSYKLLMQRT
jgi:hypothetical protein